MKKKSRVVTVVSLIAIVGLLLTATPAFAEGPPPEQPGSAKQFRDANNNKIFDNLEKRMVPAGMQQPFGVIVQFNKPLNGCSSNVARRAMLKNRVQAWPLRNNKLDDERG